MIDLTTQYLGMTLAHPIVASASPLSDSLDKIRRLEDHEIAAIVLPSLFEEQLELESASVGSDLSRGAEAFPESLCYFPELGTYNLGPDGYLELIFNSKAAVRVPVIASLNVVSRGGWIRYAKEIEQAGADAIELNLYSLESDPDRDAASLEKEYCDLVAAITRSVRLPVAVKLSPFYTAIANFARQLDGNGARGLVLFNRFYQPDFDVEALEVVPKLNLSHAGELLLRLHWAAVLSGRVKCDLAVTGGIHSATDIVKSVMAGASVTMMTSALLQNGLEHIGRTRCDLDRWLVDHEYESLTQMRGSMSQRNVGDPGAFERGNYMRVLSSYTLKEIRRD